MWTPAPRSQRLYSGEFPKLVLANSRFKLPETLITTFRNRNPGKLISFYAYPIKDREEGYRYISLFDPLFVESDRPGKLYELRDHVIAPNSEDILSISHDLTAHLGLSDSISVEGFGEIVRLWSPGEFEKYLASSEGVELHEDDDLMDFQKKSYEYRSR
jgi:hypothetical protein